jgi:hypothetical protein
MPSRLDACRPALAALLSAISVACSAPAGQHDAPEGRHDAPEGRGEPTGERAFDVIGGLRAPSPELDHTGGLVYYVRDTGATGLLCSATLIGPQTLVTANHCVAPLNVFARIGIDVTWAEGANYHEPTEAIPLAGFVPSPLPDGGAFGYGADVAVIHLARPSTVTPAAIRPFSYDLLGQSLVTLGYGVSSAAGVNDGWRRIGRETVVATSGRIYEAMFSDFESFVEWQLTGDTSDADALAALALDPTLTDLEAQRAEYDRWQLLEQYEVFTGKAPGDTQSCEGDSGSPLGRIAADGSFETFGVVSGGANSARSACDNGQVFATFGPEVFALLERERNWLSPAP